MWFEIDGPAIMCGDSGPTNALSNIIGNVGTRFAGSIALAYLMCDDGWDV
jgi:hypothetical protein